MVKRILTGLALVAVLIGFVLCGYFVHPIFIDMLVYIFYAGATYEMYKCLKDAGYKMFKLPPSFMLVALYPVFYLMQYYLGMGAYGILTVFAAACVILLTEFTFKPLDNEDIAQNDADRCAETPSAEHIAARGAYSLKDLFANVFLIVYPMLFFALAWLIGYKYSAVFAVVYAIAVPIIGGDTFAFFAGSLIGGKKLCPKISPKKTVAGLIGSIVGGVIVSVLFWVVFEYVGSLYPAFSAKAGYTPFFTGEGALSKSALVYVALGGILGVVSELGDLAASRIKRALGIKDYGAIFPGHGGFMDRIDSVLYCLVILLVAFAIIYGI